MGANRVYECDTNGNMLSVLNHNLSSPVDISFRYLGGSEACNGFDDDGNLSIDEGCDDDGDDYCDADMATTGTPPVCPLGGGDCDDSRTAIYPGAIEVCDGVDNQCPGDSGHPLSDEGTLAGNVRNALTDAAISGCQVTSGGFGFTNTDGNGAFSLANGSMPPGSVTLTASCPGYYDAVEIAQIGCASSAHVTLLMRPHSGFGVADVRSRYSGPGRRMNVLDGVSLSEGFVATVDWGAHVPGHVRWTTPRSASLTPCAGTQCQRVIDVGQDIGVGGTLTVVAVTGDVPPVESSPYLASMQVVDRPGLIPPDAFVPETTQALLGYSLKNGELKLTPIDVGTQGQLVDPEIPFFGEHELKMKATGLLTGTVDNDGRFALEFETPDWWNPEVIVGAFSMTLGVTGSLFADLDRSTGLWSDVGGSGMVDGEAILAFPPIYPWPPLPVYFEGNVGFDTSIGVELTHWFHRADGRNANWVLAGEFRPWVEGAVGAGLQGWADVEGYLRGGVVFGVRSPLPSSTCVFDGLEQFALFLRAGARAHFLFAELFDVSDTWTHEFCGANPQFGRRSNVRSPASTRRVRSRGYLNDSYAHFVANRRGPVKLFGGASGEQAIQTNVYPDSSPSLLADGNDLLLDVGSRRPDSDSGQSNKACVRTLRRRFGSMERGAGRRRRRRHGGFPSAARDVVDGGWIAGVGKCQRSACGAGRSRRCLHRALRCAVPGESQSHALQDGLPDRLQARRSQAGP